MDKDIINAPERYREENEYEYNKNYPFNAVLNVKCPNCGYVGNIVNQMFEENYRCLNCLTLFKREKLLKESIVGKSNDIFII